MQMLSDPLLGWTTIANRCYVVRQLNDHKASIDVETLKGPGLAAYAEVCGELLARGHSRSGDVQMIAGYIGKGESLAGGAGELCRGLCRPDGGGLGVAAQVEACASWRGLRESRSGEK